MEILIGLVFFLAAAYYWYRNRQEKLIEKNGFKKTRSKSKNEQTSKSEYRCVFIKTGRKACASAEALKNKPILMNEAISLPLRACDKETCNCQFTRHDDRRMGDRRNDLYVARQIMIDEKNNREKEDRRN